MKKPHRPDPRQPIAAPQQRRGGPPHGQPNQQADAAKSRRLFGFHAVRQAILNPERRIETIWATESGAAEIAPQLEQAKKAKLPRPLPQIVERPALDRMVPEHAVHQGVAIAVAPLEPPALDEILARESGLLMILDQVTDPHNVGAVLRAAAAFGADAVIVPDRHAPEITGTLAKTASGAVEVVPLIRVGNLARAMEQIKQSGFWTVGLDERGEKTLAEIDPGPKCALVMGAEDGIRRLTAEACDHLARLPTRPPIASLNVATAAAVSLYEIARRR